MSKKKILSVVLAAAMVASMAAVSAISTSAAENRTIYFDSKGLGGTAAATRGIYYCYAWGSEDGELYAWDNKKLRMTNEGNDLYSFEVPKQNSKGDDVNSNLIIFHANNGPQTYDTTFNDDCFGDTAYVTETLLENPVDSAKTAYGCAWKNTPSQGAHIAITSTGKVQGIGMLSTETPQSIVDKFVSDFQKNHDDGKEGYEDLSLISAEKQAEYLAAINEIVNSATTPTNPSAPTDPSAPTTAPTDAPTTAPTDAPTTAPTDAPTTAPTEAPTEAPTTDKYGRIPGLPMLENMNLPAKDTNRDAFEEAGAPDDWDGYYNIYYFAAPAEWETGEGKVEGIDSIGFYWFCGEINNGQWPGEAATPLKDADGNQVTYKVEDEKSPYAGQELNVYYGFAPTFATSIIWNNGASEKALICQTADLKVDDPSSTGNLADIVFNESNQEIDGVSVAGCISYIYDSKKEINGLTGLEQTSNLCKFLFYNPRTGETTTQALKDADGNYVTEEDEYWEETVALNPYFDMNYDYVNKDAEVPTAAPPATLPPADEKPTDASGNSPSQAPTTVTPDGPTTVTSPSSATSSANGSNAAGVKNGNGSSSTTSGKGVVATAEGTVAAMLGTVLVAAVAVAFVARKRRESEEA